MTTFKQFVATRRTVAPAQFEANDMRPVDLELYPNAKQLLAYDWRFEGETVTAIYYIIEMDDGFHFSFCHPGDEIAPTLDDAERQLHELIVG